MTRDDIVKWAQEAAIMPPDWGATENQWRSLEAFAKLVAEAEREWQGLTDEEIEKLYLGSFDEGQFAHAIEAKLKEKNGY